MNSRVDGDLLLQITEDMLTEDIGIRNGILRKRFIRELAHLKRITDYSSCDGSNLFHILNSLGPVYAQYTYSMLQSGVDEETLGSLSEAQLDKECRVDNSIHRLKIAEAIRSEYFEHFNSIEKSLTLFIILFLESNQSRQLSDIDGDAKSLDVFVSYRRSNGSQLAR